MSNEVISALDEAGCETYIDLLTLEKADFAELTYRVSDDNGKSIQRPFRRMETIKLAKLREFLAAVASSIGQNAIHECDWLIVVTKELWDTYRINPAAFKMRAANGDIKYYPLDSREDAAATPMSEAETFGTTKKSDNNAYPRADSTESRSKEVFKQQSNAHASLNKLSNVLKTDNSPATAEDTSPLEVPQNFLRCVDPSVIHKTETNNKIRKNDVYPTVSHDKLAIKFIKPSYGEMTQRTLSGIVREKNKEELCDASDTRELTFYAKHIKNDCTTALSVIYIIFDRGKVIQTTTADVYSCKTAADFGLAEKAITRFRGARDVKSVQVKNIFRNFRYGEYRCPQKHHNLTEHSTVQDPLTHFYTVLKNVIRDPMTVTQFYCVQNKPIVKDDLLGQTFYLQRQEFIQKKVISLCKRDSRIHDVILDKHEILKNDVGYEYFETYTKIMTCLKIYQCTIYGAGPQWYHFSFDLEWDPGGTIFYSDVRNDILNDVQQPIGQPIITTSYEGTRPYHDYLKDQLVGGTPHLVNQPPTPELCAGLTAAQHQNIAGTAKTLVEFFRIDKRKKTNDILSRLGGHQYAWPHLIHLWLWRYLRQRFQTMGSRTVLKVTSSMFIRDCIN